LILSIRLELGGTKVSTSSIALQAAEPEWLRVAGFECRTVKIENAAKILGISRNTAYEAARTGELPTIKIGRRVLVPRAALERLLDGAK
jgi:excisionase family DNA binding protein